MSRLRRRAQQLQHLIQRATLLRSYRLRRVVDDIVVSKFEHLELCLSGGKILRDAEFLQLLGDLIGGIDRVVSVLSWVATELAST